MVQESIFRPFGKEGSEPILCGNPKCGRLNPPGAKILRGLWERAAPCPRRNKPKQIPKDQGAVMPN